MLHYAVRRSRERIRPKKRAQNTDKIINYWLNLLRMPVSYNIIKCFLCDRETPGVSLARKVTGKAEILMNSLSLL